MARALAVLILALGALTLAAACGGDADLLLDEPEPDATGTPAFFQRTPQPSPEPSPTASPTAEPVAGECGDTYIVEAGDFPIKIAEKCGVATEDLDAWVDDLLEINGISDPTTLKVGQELQLPQ